MLEIRQSVPRTVLQWSFVLERAAGKYLAVDMMSRTNSAVLFALGSGLYLTFFPEYTKKELQRYLKLRSYPSKFRSDVINTKRTCFSHSVLDARIRAFTGDRWRKRIYNNVKISDYALSEDSTERKLDSLTNLDTKCGCLISHWEEECTISTYHKRMYRDNRTAKSIPSPTPQTIFCEHAIIAGDYSTNCYGTFDFGFLGPTPHVADVASDVIKEVLAKRLTKRKMPDYLLNKELRNLQSEMFKPLSDFYRHGKPP